MTQNHDNTAQDQPIIAITMGDASGIGPEIIMKALGRPEVHAMCRPLVVGEAVRLREAGEIARTSLAVRELSEPSGARYERGTVDVIDLGLIPAGHPLASSEGPLNLQDFEDHAFVSLGPKDPYRMILDRMFDEAGVTRRLPVTMQSANAVCEMVRSGLGVSILNPLTALGYLGDRVVLRGFAQAPGFVVSALHPADRPWVDSAGRLAGHLRAVCAETQQRLQALRLA